MQDVAVRAGVSVMTVSNVLSGRKTVADGTRAAVNDAIDELGYVPNLAARSLASAAPLRIGVHYRNVSHSFVNAMVVGAVSATSRLGAQMLVGHWGPTREDALAALHRLVKSGARGILIAPPFGEMITASEIDELGDVALMTLSPGAPLASISSVRVDDRQAALEVTRHLIELGHRRIAHIRGPAGHLSSRSRHDGFVAALTEAGLDVDPDLVAEGHFTFDSGLGAMSTLLDGRRPPTAVFAANDDMAAAAVALARSRNISVPDQMSIAGFDDTSLALCVFPALTTVHQPVAHMAEQAIAHLVSAVRAGPEGRVKQTYVVPHRLVFRGSTGPFSL